MLTKISYKLIVAVGSVALIIIGVFAYVILSAHQRQLISEVRRSAHQLSETVKSSTRYDMLLNQRESVHRIITTIGKQDGIKKVRIFNKDGAIIFSTDYLDVGQMVDKRAEACYACHAADQPLERLPISERTRIFQTPGPRAHLGHYQPDLQRAELLAKRAATRTNRHKKSWGCWISRCRWMTWIATCNPAKGACCCSALSPLPP